MDDKPTGFRLIRHITLNMLRVQRTIGTFVPAVSGLYIAGENNYISLLLIALTVFFLHLSSSALNDVADYESDKINHPNRLLVLGIISKKQTIILSIILMGIGLFFAFMLDLILFSIVVTLGLFLIISYSFGIKLKDRPIASLLYLNISTSAIPFIGGFIVMKNINLFSLSLVLFVTIFTSVAVIGSLKDAAGDARTNKKTIAVTLGNKKAKQIILLLLLFPIFAYPFPILLFGFSQIYLIYAILPIMIRLLITSTLIKSNIIEKLLSNMVKPLFPNHDINIPRNLMRILIAVDFIILALARPETGLSWL